MKRESSPRLLNVLLGAWLLISALMWPHIPAEMTNTWISGVLCIVFAFVALIVERGRILNAMLAIWLFVSSFAFTGTAPGTAWNNALVAIAIFLTSLVPTRPTPPLRPTGA